MHLGIIRGRFGGCTRLSLDDERSPGFFVDFLAFSAFFSIFDSIRHAWT